VQGRLKQRSYETREGEKRTVVELEVDEVGPALAFATAKVTRASRSGGGGGYSGGGQSRPQQSGGDDPWATTPAPQSGGGQGGYGGGQQSGGPQGNDPWGAPGVGSDEPPF